MHEKPSVGPAVSTLKHLGRAASALLQKRIVQGGIAPQALNLVLYAVPALLLHQCVSWDSLGGLDGVGWGIMCFLGANTLLAYGALGEALKRLPAYQVSLIITTNPLITLAVMELLRSLDPVRPKREDSRCGRRCPVPCNAASCSRPRGSPVSAWLSRVSRAPYISSPGRVDGVVMEYEILLFWRAEPVRKYEASTGGCQKLRAAA